MPANQTVSGKFHGPRWLVIPAGATMPAGKTIAELARVGTICRRVPECSVLGGQSAVLWRSARVLFMLVAIFVVITPATGGDSLQDRHRAIETMTPIQKEQLRAKQRRFERLIPAEKQRLRTLHQDLTDHQQSDQLRDVMSRYFDWLKTLSAGEVAQLSELSPEERIERIKQLKEKQQMQHFRRLAGVSLNGRDVRAILDWFDEYLVAHRAELLDEMAKNSRNQFQRGKNPRQRRKLMFLALRQNRLPVKFPVPRPEEVRRRKDLLSEQANRHLDSYTNEQQKLKRIRELVRIAELARYRQAELAGRVSPARPEDLEQFYLEELNSQQREKLELLAPGHFEKELHWMYIQHHRRGAEVSRPPRRVRGSSSGRLRPVPDRRPPSDRP